MKSRDESASRQHFSCNIQDWQVRDNALHLQGTMMPLRQQCSRQKYEMHESHMVESDDGPTATGARAAKHIALGCCCCGSGGSGSGSHGGGCGVMAFDAASVCDTSTINGMRLRGRMQRWRR